MYEHRTLCVTQFKRKEDQREKKQTVSNRVWLYVNQFIGFPINAKLQFIIPEWLRYGGFCSRFHKIQFYYLFHWWGVNIRLTFDWESVMQWPRPYSIKYHVIWIVRTFQSNQQLQHCLLQATQPNGTEYTHRHKCQ